MFTVVRAASGWCCSRGVLLKDGSLRAGYTGAWLSSAELGRDGTGVAALACVANDTDSALLF